MCKAEYSTDEPGLYTISLLLDDAPINKSPFKVFIAPAASQPSSVAHSESKTKKTHQNGRQASNSEKPHSSVYAADERQNHEEEAARIHQRALNEFQQQENQPVCTLLAVYMWATVV